MGEVYRAKDTRLDRTVAIKILPPQFSADAVYKQRFEREAKIISRLNHPHICVLHDIGQQDGIDYLVMELVEGETLAKRLEKGPLPLEQVLKLGAQIAEALDKAHRNGIAHRDLKPGNIMLTRSGAKLLDFGLAKSRGPEAVWSGPSSLPTQDGALTDKGTILGTLQYMAPEQLDGKEADVRTDIFAFGAVLHEMATGRKAFAGKSQASLIAAIMEHETAPISTLQPMTPATLDRVVKTCLAKDPDERWQSAQDLKLQLQWIAESGPQSGGAGTISTRRKRWERWAWIVTTTVLFLAALPFVVAYLRRPPAEARTLKLFLLPPEKATFGSSAISPDGRQLSFVATADGKKLLWVRPLDSLTAKALAGTEGAAYPFWSPDSRFIGFFTQDKLKKIEVFGGPAQTLSDVVEGRGGTWNRNGEIVFAPNYLDALYRISTAGGEATPVTTLDRSHQENSHRWPYFLPDGRHFLYFVRSAQRDQQGLYVGSLDSKDKKRLLSAAGSTAYVAPGYLLFVRDGMLVAQPFDAGRLQITGEPFSVAQRVGYDSNMLSNFSVSDTDVLTYRRGDMNTQLIWVDRGGKQLGSIAAPPDYERPQLSPDEKRLAGARLDPETGAGDIWLLELSRGTLSRFTFDPWYDYLPVWSPDGSRIVFASNPDGPTDLYLKALSGTGQSGVLLKSSTPKEPNDWSLDGRFILYDNLDLRTKKRDLWVLPLSGDRQPRPFLQTPFDERQGRFSPDGRSVAYVSDESGRFEVYVQSFPTPGGKWQISTEGGSDPRWRRDGKELFYRAADGKLMAVEVKGGSIFEARSPKVLLATPPLNFFDRNYAVTADGQRFLISTPVRDASSEMITVVINWTAELRR
jgi:Tol biopolymer transport system component